MKLTKKQLIKTFLLLIESEDTTSSDSSSQGKTSLEKRQPGTIWITSPGHWGAKNPDGNVKYFDAEEPAQNYADGLDDGSTGSSTSKDKGVDKKEGDKEQAAKADVKTASKVVTKQTSQTKYVKDIDGMVAKDKTLSFSPETDTSDFNIGGVPFDYASIPEEFETDYEHNALKLPNGKTIALSHLLDTDEDFVNTENDPDIKPLSETGANSYSAGVIIEEDDGRVWIVKPKNAFGGYKATFPKGGLDNDVVQDWDELDPYTRNMELRTAAVREAFEETGLVVQIQDLLGDIERSTTYNRFYIAKRIGGSPTNFQSDETSEVKLLHPGEAEKETDNPYDKKLLAMYKAFRQQNPKELKFDDSDESLETESQVTIGPVYEPRVGGSLYQTRDVVLKELVPWDKSGSNQGGRYRGADGKMRYVKNYQNDYQGPGEHLANIIYRCLGYRAPVSGIAGKTFFSEIIPGVKELKDVGLNKDRARRILDGFVADVLTANWDVVGLNLDNIVYEPNSDVPIRIDNGAAFFSRAQGEKKPDSVLNKTTELEGFLDPSTNAQYSQVFAASEYTKDEFKQEIKKQVKHMLKLFGHHGNWEKFTEEALNGHDFYDRHGFGKRAGEMLNKRTFELAKYAGMLTDVDTVSEYKKPIVASGLYDIPSQIQARYDLTKDLPAYSHILEDERNIHSNLVHLDKAAREAVSHWKRSSIWSYIMEKRKKIINSVRNLFKHSGDKLEISAKSLVRGMYFPKDSELTKLFLRGFKPGKTVRLLPSGFSSDIGTAMSTGAASTDMNSDSIVLRVRPQENQKLRGIHIANVKDFEQNYATHTSEQEVILSDDTAYLVEKMYRQPVQYGSQTKTTYIIELRQVISKGVNESIETEVEEVDKVWEFVVNMCMVGGVKAGLPTTEQMREMAEFLKN
jgi:8-oxo-dGTP pyrophosphatase MutT (NUDIX family)